MSTDRVRLAPTPDDPFAAAVRAEVAACLAARGGPGGGARAWARVAAVAAWTLLAYALVLGPWVPMGPWRLVPAFALGAGLALVGMCIGHDALHGALSPRPRVNALVGLSFDLIGASSYVWKRTHNRTHHVFTNVEGVDVDLDYGAALRMSPGAPWRPWHRWQWLYGPPLYALAGVKWHLVTDVDFYRRTALGPYRPQRHRRLAWLGITLCKLWALTYSVAIPWLVARPTAGQFAAGYLATFLTAGFALGMTFQLAHAVEGVDFVAPDAAGRVAGSYFAAQVRATANFACDSALVTWLCGGLNHQIEHHLFPQVCSVHYPALRPIVRAACARFGLPYREAPTVLAALRGHVRHLRRLGRPPPEGCSRAQ